MTKKLFIFFSSCLLIITHMAQAQKSSAQISGISDAVSARVVEISLITKMPPVRQCLLAKYIARKDSLIMSGVRSGMGSADMETLLTKLQDEFEVFLTQEERQRYFSSINKDFIQREARVTGAYYSRKYHTRPEVEAMIYRVNFIKNDDLSRAFSIESTTAGGNRIESVLTKYDSLSAIYLSVAKGQAYLEDRIVVLDSLKRMTEKQKETLRNNFFNLCLKKGDDYLRNFQSSLTFVPGNEIYIQYLYQDSLKESVVSRTNEESKNLSYKYGLADSLVKVIYPILLEKNRFDMEYELSLPYGFRRDSLQKSNIAHYDALVKKKLIRSGYYSLSDNRFIYAIKLGRMLKLTNSQVDSLVDFNYRLDIMSYHYSLSDPWSHYDGSNFINRQLNRILSEGQLDTLFRVESSPLAIKNARKDLTELKVYGLLKELDSAVAFNQIFSYHLNRLVLSRRYSDNEALLAKLLKRNAEMKPQSLIRLDAARRLNEYDTVIAPSEQSK